MSLIHRVIILNKPLKIFEFTIPQLIVLAGSVLFAFAVSSMIPKEWNLIPKDMKAGSLPTNILTFITLLCIAIALVKALEMRPFVWWKNNVFYRLKIVPSVYLPHLEEGQDYPDTTIVETARSADQFYVE